LGCELGCVWAQRQDITRVDNFLTAREIPLIMLSTIPIRRPLRCFVLGLVFSMSLLESVFADTTKDEYILGYSTAILEQQFKIKAGALQVKDGVITVMAKDLPATDRDRVVNVLKEINGVVRVDVLDGDVQPVTPPPPAPQPERTAVALGETKPEGGEFLPSGRLFDPFIADPRAPHFSMAYHSYLNDDELSNVAAVSLGTTVGIYENDFFGAGRWQFGIQGAVFAIFDLDAPSDDLVNADYVLGLPLSYRVKGFSASLRLYHQSSHLGDEFLLRTQTNRINVSYEGVELRLSQEFFKRVVRLYAGGPYLPHCEPADLKQWSGQGGIELRSPWTLGKHIRPVAAFDAQAHEESDWKVDYSGRAGIQFDSEKLRDRQLQLMFEYYNGRSPNGQFFVRRIEYIGVGIHFYYD
jgi:hypothetical protein